MTPEQFAKALAEANQKMINRFFLWVGAVYFVIVAIGWFSNGQDSTDSATQRSNMRLHTDALTGCQYLSVQGGGVTPRLDQDGDQHGCK